MNEVGHDVRKTDCSIKLWECYSVGNGKSEVSREMTTLHRMIKLLTKLKS